MSVCLTMVVKNEAERIRKALTSAKPYIDRWLIVDTGSTDDTKIIILDEMTGIPGNLIDRPWVGWTPNRNELLDLARETNAEYYLLLDGDQEIVAIETVNLTLSPDFAYWAIHQQGTTEFKKPFIIPAKFNWHHVGATHEYLTCDPDNPTQLTLPVIIKESCRGKSPEYFLNDAKILEEELRKDPYNARNVFYLAQSYRDAGATSKAIELYFQRAAMNGWKEETWYSLYQVAVLEIKRGDDRNKIIADFLRAYEFNPKRSEALGALAQYCRDKRLYNLAYLFAEKACQIPLPDERLFLDRSYYEWRNRDEYALGAYYAGYFHEAANAWASLLNGFREGQRLPEEERDRVKKNLEFARKLDI
jgi:glycosyltransferase involved in cell wall biosynthesis